MNTRENDIQKSMAEFIDALLTFSNAPDFPGKQDFINKLLLITPDVNEALRDPHEVIKAIDNAFRDTQSALGKLNTPKSNIEAMSTLSNKTQNLYYMIHEKKRAPFTYEQSIDIKQTNGKIQTFSLQDLLFTDELSEPLRAFFITRPMLQFTLQKAIQDYALNSARTAKFPKLKELLAFKENLSDILHNKNQGLEFRLFDHLLKTDTTFRPLSMAIEEVKKKLNVEKQMSMQDKEVILAKLDETRAKLWVASNIPDSITIGLIESFYTDMMNPETEIGKYYEKYPDAKLKEKLAYVHTITDKKRIRPHLIDAMGRCYNALKNQKFSTAQKVGIGILGIIGVGLLGAAIFFSGGLALGIPAAIAAASAMTTPALIGASAGGAIIGIGFLAGIGNAIRKYRQRTFGPRQLLNVIKRKVDASIIITNERPQSERDIAGIIANPTTSQKNTFTETNTEQTTHKIGGAASLLRDRHKNVSNPDTDKERLITNHYLARSRLAIIRGLDNSVLEAIDNDIDKLRETPSENIDFKRVQSALEVMERQEAGKAELIERYLETYSKLATIKDLPERVLSIAAFDIKSIKNAPAEQLIIEKIEQDRRCVENQFLRTTEENNSDNSKADTQEPSVQSISSGSLSRSSSPGMFHNTDKLDNHPPLPRNLSSTDEGDGWENDDDDSDSEDEESSAGPK